MNLFIIKILAPIIGSLCGYLLYLGKHNAFVYQNFKLDRLFSVARYTIFIFFLYTALQLKTTDSILLIVLFLLSYLGTVYFCTNKTG